MPASIHPRILGPWRQELVVFVAEESLMPSGIAGNLFDLDPPAARTKFSRNGS